ncbi:putative reverse transcriptase domain-containing protein [Tanacetum coccineum]
MKRWILLTLALLESEPEDVIEVENTIESEDTTVPTSVHERLCGRGGRMHGRDEKEKGKGRVFWLTMGKMSEKLNAEDKPESKKLKKELEEARFSNIFLRMQNERVERNLYWTRVQAHEFYQEMIRKGFVIMPPKSAPLTQAAIHRMIKESVDAAIAAERERHANAGNDARGSGPVRGQDAAPVVRECTFAGFMKCNPTVFHDTEGAVELRRWFEKTESVFGISECAEGKKVKALSDRRTSNKLALMCPRMVEPESVKVDAYIRGLTDNNKGEVTSSKPANLNEAVHMAHKLMEQKSQARDERILEEKKRKCESFQSGNSSGKSNHKDNSRQTSQNNQKQENARSMITAPTDGKVSSGSLPLCERFFTRHVGPCTIKCHKRGKVGHKASKVILGTDAQRRLSKRKLENCGRAYAIKDVEPQVNHIFEIDLMPIELGTFDVIIGMDWLVKHDAVIVYGEKVVRIPYGNKRCVLTKGHILY